jgi:hypothetical protein
MLLFIAIQSFLYEVGLIEILSPFFHKAFKNLHVLFIMDLQAFLAQNGPKGKTVLDDLESDAQDTFDEESLSNGQQGYIFNHLQKKLAQVIFICGL